MKEPLNNIISAFAVIAPFFITLIMNIPAVAQPGQRVYINDLIHSSSLDFFKAGREQFDREVERLINGKNSFSDSILIINPEIQKQIQEQQKPLNKPVNLDKLQESNQVEQELKIR